MDWLNGGWPQLGLVAGKAALMYVMALVALRAGQRRTLAQWTIIDFITAVAIGAIVGRTALAGTQSFITGAVALVALVVAHRVASVLRFNPWFARVVDHRVRVLVEHGRVRKDQLRICGLTDDDLYAEMRQEGVFSLSDVALVLYEVKGGLTIVPEHQGQREWPELVRAGIASAADANGAG
jgi:uncharacterized membrane protein YcaP (DUF421 family)